MIAMIMRAMAATMIAMIMRAMAATMIALLMILLLIPLIEVHGSGIEMILEEKEKIRLIIRKNRQRKHWATILKNPHLQQSSILKISLSATKT